MKLLRKTRTAFAASALLLAGFGAGALLAATGTAEAATHPPRARRGQRVTNTVARRR